MRPSERTGKKFSYLLYLTAIVTVMMPCAARADVSYTFLKMTCDPDTKSATIKVFFEANEAGKNRAAAHEKDIYYLDDIGSSEPQEYGKKIVCDFGGGRAVAFATHVGDVPKDDGLQLFFSEGKDNRSFARWGGYGLGSDGLTLYIKAIDQNEYIVKYCPDDAFQLENLGTEQQKRLIEQHKTKCEAVHVQNGVTTGSEEIVDPPSE